MDDGGEQDEMTEAVMEATFEALSTHGYADLTIQRIADAFPKSKSLLYYHYDDKEDILGQFLDWLVAEFESSVEADFRANPDDPGEALEAVLDQLLPRDLDPEERTFRVAIFSLQAQATHDPEYAARFADLYESIETAIATVVRQGVEDGTFREVEPEPTARLLLAVASGGETRALTTGAEFADFREALDVVVEQTLYD